MAKMARSPEQSISSSTQSETTANSNGKSIYKLSTTGNANSLWIFTIFLRISLLSNANGALFPTTTTTIYAKSNFVQSTKSATSTTIVATTTKYKYSNCLSIFQHPKLHTSTAIQTTSSSNIIKYICLKLNLVFFE
jgi:hypothetical protein